MKVGMFPMKVGHGTHSSVEFIKRTKPGVFANTEMDLGHATAIPVIREVFGKSVDIYSRDRGGHSQEIPIILRRGPLIRPLGFKLHRLSQDGGAQVGGMGNDRWLGELHFEAVRRIYAIFAIHTDAGVQHTAGGKDLGELLASSAGQTRWKRYQQEMARAEEIVHEVVDDSAIDVTVLMGDMNMLPTGAGLHENHSPHQTYLRLGMDYVNSRVVYIGVHGSKINHHMEYPPGQAGWLSDHGGLMAWIY